MSVAVADVVLCGGRMKNKIDSKEPFFVEDEAGWLRRQLVRAWS